MISVLIPSRDRAVQLRASIHSLLLTAQNPGQVQIMVAADPDDQKTVWAARSLFELHEFACGTPGLNDLWIAPRRFGYQDLHCYYNNLAARAEGEWLFIWNDDAMMRTSHWDEIVCRYSPPVQALWPRANHHPQCNLFPIFPAEWFWSMAHVALCWNVDTWIEAVSRKLGLEQTVDITVWHERGDGVRPPGVVDHFPLYEDQRNADAEKIRTRMVACDL